jgi:polysaccharide export outer membrane protein
MMQRSIALALALGALVACGSTLPKYDYSKEPDPRGAEYVLGVADEIRITVWRHRELSGTFIVPPNGKVTLPLIGDVVAAGRTTTALRNDVQTKLSAYIKDQSAQVAVRLTEMNSYRFSVGGEVSRPNLFTPKSFVTVTEAVAMAGGFTRFAKPSKMYILRIAGQKTKKPRRIPLDYWAIIRGGRSDMNLVVLPGDIIQVP